MHRLLTIDEAADELGVPRAAMRAAAERYGLLVRMGRAVRIDPNDLGELVKKMPRPSKGARLYRRSDRGVWIIRDGDRRLSTGVNRR